jgi:hypothetical protein
MFEICLFVVGAVFVALKFASVITWSWWIVTSPFWGYLLLFLFLRFLADLVKDPWS